MISWAEFERDDPGLAAFGRERLNDRVAYLGTIRSDGSPRVHPVSGRIREGRLIVRMDPASPKAKDLRRNGRYALHSQVLDTSGAGGEFAVSAGPPPLGRVHLRPIRSSLRDPPSLARRMVG